MNTVENALGAGGGDVEAITGKTALRSPLRMTGGVSLRHTVCGLMMLLSVVTAGELRFLNGDRVVTEVLRMERGRFWLDAAWVDLPLEVPARYVGLMVEPIRDVPSRMELPVPVARMKLVNGDVLELTAVSLEGQAYQVSTSWGMDLVVARNLVEDLIFFEPNSRVMLQGVEPLSAWEIPQVSNVNEIPPVRVPHGVRIQARATLRRPLPENMERFILEYKLVLPEHAHNLQITLTETQQGRQTQAPTLTFTHSTQRLTFVAVQAMGQRQPNLRAHWQVPIQGDAPHLYFRLYFDLVQARFGIQLNDQWLNLWGLEDFEFNEGWRQPMLGLLYQHGSDRVEFSHFRVLSWDGQLPEEVPELLQQPPEDLDRIILRNGDVLYGAVVGVQGDMLEMITTEQVKLHIPLRQVSRMATAKDQANPPILHSRDVRIHFENGINQLTVRLDEITETELLGEITGIRDAFQVSREHVRYIQFNPYTPFRKDHSPRNWPDFFFGE